MEPTCRYVFATDTTTDKPLINAYHATSSYSCGYRKAFEEYSSLLREKYPELGNINGENYDPPGMNLYLSKGVLITKLLLIFVLMTGFDIWAYMGQAIPGWWNWATTNKIYACMMIFFVGNMIEAQVSDSGALTGYQEVD